MTLSYKTDAFTKRIEVIVDGTVTDQDYYEIAPELEHFIEENAPVDILEIVRHYKMKLSPSVLWEGIKLDFRQINNIRKCAVISDISWVSPLTKAFDALSKPDMKSFKLGEEAEARRWLDQ